MKDIIKRLRDVNDDSLIMEVVRDCLDAAEEIKNLREECASKQLAMKKLKKIIINEEKAASEKAARMTTTK